MASDSRQGTSLRLIAQDADGLVMISALAQDSITHVGEVLWQPRRNRLLIAANRIVRETGKASRGKVRRCRTVLAFDRVVAVRASAIAMDQQQTVLQLLSITFEPSADPSGRILLAFAGGGRIALEVECVEMSLADQPASWESTALPDHDADDT